MPTGLVGSITDFEDGESIDFLYYEDITDAVDPVYDDQAVRGRSEEHTFYSHTSAEVYNFAITLSASTDEADNGTPEQIWYDHLFIKSFAFPDYGPANRGPVRAPRKAIITIGQFFNKPGIIKAPNFVQKKPYSDGGYPYIIECSFQFRIVSPTPRSLFDIRANIL